MEIKLGFGQKDRERDWFSLIYKQIKHLIGKNFLGAYK